MKIEHKMLRSSGFLEKELTAVMFSDVTLEDAKKLYLELHHLRMNYCGTSNGVIQLNFSAIYGNNFVGQRIDTPEQADTFCNGFALGILLTGRDVMRECY